MNIVIIMNRAMRRKNEKIETKRVKNGQNMTRRIEKNKDKNTE